MKQLLILSGKGGTGKTTVAGSLIKLSSAKAFADCDVDAPNLHLVMLQNAEPLKKEFFGLDVARINPDMCNSCGLCKQICRFDAIKVNDGYAVDCSACEGCAVCTLVCPTNAIDMVPRVIGNLSLYKNGHVFSTAQLLMGSGNSGLLVTQVKKDLFKNSYAPLAIIDGSPGIGCPVIASINGVDMVLLVTEPTLSGFSDMERIVQTAKGFPAKIVVCINKFDLHKENSKKIKQYCEDNGIPFMGEIPFDKHAVTLVNNGLTLVDKEGLSKKAIELIYANIVKLLNGENEI